MRCILQLKPLLLASPGKATVVSVYAGGNEATLFPEDLSLRDPKHFSFANCRSHCVYMKTMMFERLAKENPDKLSLSHLFPGIVISPGYYGDHYPCG
ncbi:hypothetical protein MRB53_039907 [Persea americana]|nr:hypothetical protein MRB53_039907 [Persea americana]